MPNGLNLDNTPASGSPNNPLLSPAVLNGRGKGKGKGKGADMPKPLG